MPSFASLFTSRQNPRPAGLSMALPGIWPLGLVPFRRPPAAWRWFGCPFVPFDNPGPVGLVPPLPGTGPFGLRTVRVRMPVEPAVPTPLAAPVDEGAIGTAPVLAAPADTPRLPGAVVPADALKRRELSLRHLTLDGIPVYEDLPCLPGRDEVQLRAHRTIHVRMQALFLLAGLAQGQYTRAEFDHLVHFFGLHGAFDEHEQAFLGLEHPSEADKLPFCWGQEAVWALLWAVGGVPVIGRPTALCDVRQAVTVITGQSVAMLYHTTRLRPVDEILGEADRTYRYHWAVHDAQLHRQPMPGGLIPEVVEQRRMALEWLIGRGGPSEHPGAGWIEVDLST